MKPMRNVGVEDEHRPPRAGQRISFDNDRRGGIELAPGRENFRPFYGGAICLPTTPY